MSTDPEEIRDDIERTRAELSSDVDALTDKVSPTQVAHRQADKVRAAASDQGPGDGRRRWRRRLRRVSRIFHASATRARSCPAPPRTRLGAIRWRRG